MIEPCLALTFFISVSRVKTQPGNGMKGQGEPDA